MLCHTRVHLETRIWNDTSLESVSDSMVGIDSSIRFLPLISMVLGSIGQFISTRKKTVFPFVFTSSMVRNRTICATYTI